jgi:hypothetical protein
METFTTKIPYYSNPPAWRKPRLVGYATYTKTLGPTLEETVNEILKTINPK